MQKQVQKMARHTVDASGLVIGTSFVVYAGAPAAIHDASRGRVVGNHGLECKRRTTERKFASQVKNAQAIPARSGKNRQCAWPALRRATLSIDRGTPSRNETNVSI